MNRLEVTDCTPFISLGAEQRTLAEVDLDVQDGEMVAVLGPSGSGKTTLLRVAAGLEPAASGDVLLDGMCVSDVSPERRDLTVMFRKPHLFPQLDVLDNVAFADRVRGRSRSQSRAAAQRYLTWSAWGTSRGAGHVSCPVARSNVWPWHGLWPPGAG